MKVWISWVVSMALAFSPATFAKPPLKLTELFKQTGAFKKHGSLGELVDSLLVAWPENLRERWRPYFEGARQEKAPKVEFDGSRLLLSSATGSLVVEFQDPGLQFVLVNGKKIWMQDLLQVHAGVRQIEQAAMSKPKVEFFMQLLSGPAARAEISLLLVAALAALLAGSGWIAEAFGWGLSGRSSESSGSSSGSAASRSPPSAPARAQADAPVPPPQPRFNDANAGTRCPAYPQVQAGAKPGSYCDVTDAISDYGLSFDESRRLFCGDQAWLAGVSAGDARRNEKIDGKTTEIEKRYAAGLAESLRSAYSRADGARKRDETSARQNFRKCVQTALQNEMSGCNPNQPVEALVAEKAGRFFTLQVCPGSSRNYASKTETNSSYFGATLRSLTAREGGSVQPLNPCAVGREGIHSCDQLAPGGARSNRAPVPLGLPGWK